MNPADRPRFLVLHDYGMGGLWWWIRAASAEAILEAVAEVEVITDAQTLDAAAIWNLSPDEVDLDAVSDAGLTDLIQQRTAERGDPDYGRLLGRTRVYVRDTEEDNTCLLELGPDGRRIREVELLDDGQEIRVDDWLFNTPFDFRSPVLARNEIPAAVFEEHWARARPATAEE